MGMDFETTSALTAPITCCPDPTETARPFMAPLIPADQTAPITGTVKRQRLVSSKAGHVMASLVKTQDRRTIACDVRPIVGTKTSLKASLQAGHSPSNVKYASSCFPLTVGSEVLPVLPSLRPPASRPTSR